MSWPHCQREGDVSHCQEIEVFRNNIGASTGEEGDRRVGRERVEKAVRPGYSLIEEDRTWSHTRGLFIAY